MKLIRFSPASFIHFGTTKELLSLMTVDMQNYRFLDWSSIVNSNYHGEKFAVYNSYIDKYAVIGKNCYIEDSNILESVVVGEDSIISGITLRNVSVPEKIVLHGLKLKDERYVCRMYRVGDNPKECRWMNKELDEPLWTKPLFKICESMEDAVKATLAYDSDGELISLKDSFEAADVTAILPWQNKLNDKVIAETILESIDNRLSADEVIKLYPNGVSERVKRYLLFEADKLNENNLEEFSRKIRIYYYGSKLIDNDNLSNKCFDTICDSVLATQ
ncbi:MAG: hypothetical protein GX567_14815, partial [Clostridia bacterium]|nr:hypothetical protein [Clostridia bacterium]